jgi:hypothetical protein
VQNVPLLSGVCHENHPEVWLCLAIRIIGFLAMLATNSVFLVSQAIRNLVFLVFLWSCIAETLLVVLHDSIITLSEIYHFDKTERRVRARIRFRESYLMSVCPAVLVKAIDLQIMNYPGERRWGLLASGVLQRLCLGRCQLEGRASRSDSVEI